MKYLWHRQNTFSLSTSICPLYLFAPYTPATLIYKFPHSGFPRYFAPYLSSYSSYYSTRRSQSSGIISSIFLSFQTSTSLFIYLFCNSFTFDALTIWNAFSDEIWASPSLVSFRKQLETCLYTKAYPP